MNKEILIRLIKQVDKKQANQSALLNREYLKNIGVEDNVIYNIDKNYKVKFIASHRHLATILYYKNRLIQNSKILYV